jgi:peptide/nickel transport system ATP-binding protein
MGDRLMGGPVLEVQDLSVVYRTQRGTVPAVQGAGLTIGPGEALGLVGESGSGKTTLALGAVGYVSAGGRISAGKSLLRGSDLLALPRRDLRHIWGSRIGTVAQDPQGAFNPTLTIGRQLDEVAGLHLGLKPAAARRATLEMLERVGMPAATAVAARYPHQLSGGMLQRCAIAMALLPRPELLLLDEPTTSLDVTIQALLLDLLHELRAEFELAILYITHNLAVVAQFCDRVAVMYAGKIVEEAGAVELFARPLHPYTANLLRCAPRLGTTAEAHKLATIGGQVPQLDALPPGCSFAPRCPLAMDRCEEGSPTPVEGSAGHRTACIRWETLLTPEGLRTALQRDNDGLTAQPEEGNKLPGGTIGAARPAEAKYFGGVAGTGEPSPVLAIEAACKTFRQRRPHLETPAVDGATLSIPYGRTFGLVGESGSGKTTLARLIAGLTRADAGTVRLGGLAQEASVAKRHTDALRLLQMVFQNPDASLNPRHTVGEALVRPLRLLKRLDRKAAAQEAGRLLAQVRLPASYLDRYPGELSGGEKQRVAIARAFAAEPALIVCDEPVSSLDVSVQGAIINLLIDLQDTAGTSYLFISHDLAAVQQLSHLIGVMYLGKLVEQGRAARVLTRPYHPYTESLLSAVPVPDPGVRRRRVALRDSPPTGPRIPSGCRFHPRCPRYLGDICRTVEPPWRLADGPGAVPLAAGAPTSDALAASADLAICCHIPLDELAALQQET